MIRTIKAIYEHGVLRPLEPITGNAEGTRFTITHMSEHPESGEWTLSLVQKASESNENLARERPDDRQ